MPDSEGNGLIEGKGNDDTGGWQRMVGTGYQTSGDNELIGGRGKMMLETGNWALKADIRCRILWG